MSSSATRSSNYATFRDCFASSVLEVIHRTTSPPPRPGRTKGQRKAILSSPQAPIRSGAGPTSNENDDLAEFLDVCETIACVIRANSPQYLSTEIFEALPEELQLLSYSALQNDARMAKQYDTLSGSALAESIAPRLPASVTDSFETYALLPSSFDFHNLLVSVLADYVAAVAAPPPVWATTRTSACEICDRDWIPLTYHHLIPKQVHEKALKRKWHEEWRLNSVAWLCRACHSFVHRIASNEELGKDLWSVELLMEREDVQAWARWVRRVRWKAR